MCLPTLLKGITLSYFKQANGKVIARHLFGGEDELIEIRREAAVEQREISNIAQIQLEQLRRHPGGHGLAFPIMDGLRSRASLEQQFLDAVDGKVTVRMNGGPSPFVQFGQKGQFAQNEIQRRVLDPVPFRTAGRRFGIR